MSPPDPCNANTAAVRQLATATVRIGRLVEHPEHIPELTFWFEQEWPAYFAQFAPGKAEQDIQTYCNEGSLPLGLIALADGVPCGFAALKREAFPTHPDLSPWAGAMCVPPPLRRQGIGRRLVACLETEAKVLGHSHIYCATGTSMSLFERSGWSVLEQVQHQGQALAVLAKAL